MSPQVFVATHVTPKQEALSQIDERTSQFFQKMMVAVNIEVDNVPTLPQSLQMLGMVTQDQQLRKKLVEGIALPTVQRLITDFDGINNTIVDDINKS